MNSSIRENLWLWAHQAGGHNGMFGLPGHTSIAPAEAAESMGIENAIMVVFGGEPKPPFEPHALPLRKMRKLVWSAIGDGSSTRNDNKTDLEAVLALAESYPNLCGAILDDFFNSPPDRPGVFRCDVPTLAAMADRLHRAPRRLDLWMVLYTHQLDLPLAPYLAHADVVTFWTWFSRDLANLERNFDRARAMLPGKRIVLGCYMWDYGDGKPMPIPAMEHQCRLGLEWLRRGEIEGMIMLGSNLVELDLETLHWTRKWIAQQCKP